MYKIASENKQRRASAIAPAAVAGASMYEDRRSIEERYKDTAAAAYGVQQRLMASTDPRERATLSVEYKRLGLELHRLKPMYKAARVARSRQDRDVQDRRWAKCLGAAIINLLGKEQWDAIVVEAKRIEQERIGIANRPAPPQQETKGE